MLQRGLLRLSKRGSKKQAQLGSVSSVSVDGSIKSCTEDEWTKYDDRLIDSAYHSDTDKIKETIRKKGVSPVKLSRDGQTALHISVKKGLVDAVDFMLGGNPDLSIVDIQGRTVYHISAINGDAVMLKKLLDYSRWNLEIKDSKEMTALHHAVSSGHEACVKLLLENKSPVELRDNEGRTPLLLSIISGHDKIAMTLILHGVDVSAQDYKERTPVIMACIQGMPEVVALLVSKGADPKIEDAEGKTLEDIAAEAGHTEIVQILRSGTDSGIVESDHEDNAALPESDSTGQNGDNGLLSSTQSKRKSLKNEESSFTNSIIESLMGYDVSSDTVSEMSATEDQLHMKEKVEQERKDMELEIVKRDKRIEELEHEIISLKSKLRWETEMRFAAEKEVMDLKIKMENMSTTPVSFLDKVIEEQTIDESEEDGAHRNEEVEETKIFAEIKLDNTENQTKDYESDGSINEETEYGKKSLGTAKQHIDMLEEHILTLEEDLANKDHEINQLEEKLKSTRELVDLNNNTTVSLEVFNQYKAEKKTERNKFKDEIKALESQISEMETKIKELENEKEIESNELSKEKDELSNLKQKLISAEKQYSKDIQSYREHLLALYQDKLDEKLKEVLSRIVKLRTC